MAALALLSIVLAAPALAGPPGAPEADAVASAPAPDEAADAGATNAPGIFGKVGRAISAGAIDVRDWLGRLGDGREGEEAAADADAEAAAPAGAESPTLANARWIGFAPAVYTGADPRPGAWIAGPFDREQRTGWIADTATGATARATLIWREPGRGGAAILSGDAAEALGLRPGDVANLAIYLPR